MTRLRISGALLLAAAIAAASCSLPSGETTQVTRAAQAACDGARSVAEKTPGTIVEQSIGSFEDEALPQPVHACRVKASGLFSALGTKKDASGAVRDHFREHGWEELARYAADGPDGTASAFRSDEVGCIVRGRWDGGADGEPEIAPEDWYLVTVTCMSPAPPE